MLSEEPASLAQGEVYLSRRPSCGCYILRVGRAMVTVGFGLFLSHDLPTLSTLKTNRHESTTALLSRGKDRLARHTRHLRVRVCSITHVSHWATTREWPLATWTTVKYTESKQGRNKKKKKSQVQFSNSAEATSQPIQVAQHYWSTISERRRVRHLRREVTMMLCVSPRQTAHCLHSQVAPVMACWVQNKC